MSIKDILKDNRELLAKALNSGLYNLSNSILLKGGLGGFSPDKVLEIDSTCLQKPIESAEIEIIDGDIFIVGFLTQTHEDFELMVFISPAESGMANVDWAGQRDHLDQVYLVTRKIAKDEPLLRIKVGEIKKTGFSLGELINIDKTKLVVL